MSSTTESDREGEETNRTHRGDFSVDLLTISKEGLLEEMEDNLGVIFEICYNS